MSTILQKFLAARATKSDKQMVTNQGAVTRDEYNTLVRAVHCLIEDFDTATSPAKMQAAFNAALQDAAPAAPAPTHEVGNIMPARTPTPASIANAGKTARPPLALKAD